MEDSVPSCRRVCRGRTGWCDSNSNEYCTPHPLDRKRSTDCEGLQIPSAAAGGLANIKALLRNAALLLAVILLNASVQRIPSHNKGGA